jgi:hypothetical protein
MLNLPHQHSAFAPQPNLPLQQTPTASLLVPCASLRHRRTWRWAAQNTLPLPTSIAMPSRLTLKWLAACILLASLICFQLFAANLNCGAQSWDCATLPGIALVSMIAGVGLGLFLTASVVLIGWCSLFFRPSARSPETKSRSVLVAFNLVVLHLLAFGLMQVVGTLPLGWLWWLGVFGAVGIHPAGSEYLIR